MPTGDHSGPRLGTLSCGGVTVETPAMLVQTLGGSLPLLPPDLAATLPVDIALVDIAEVYNALFFNDAGAP